MNEKKLIGKSRYLSLILRHDPGSIGMDLDREGWAELRELFERTTAAGNPLDAAVLAGIMELPGKKRFELSADGRRVRAMQGHSAAGVDLAYEPVTPPESLYHGTADRFLDSIREKGLLPGKRHLVHLSPDTGTAMIVGRRHGRPVALTIAALAMHATGREFYLAGNGVWLTGEVPAEFIRFP